MGTLTGTFTLPDGTPEVGTMTFRLTGRAVNTSHDTVYTEGPIGAHLDDTGSFSVDLVAVDDPGFTDTVVDLAYEVVEHLTSRPSVARYIMPTGAGPWEYEGLVWYDAPPATATLPLPGAEGTAATITVGTTLTGGPGTDAEVTNSGTSSAAVFDFTIPRGVQGAQGIPGEVQNSDIWVPGNEAFSPIVTRYVPATGEVRLGSVHIGDTGWRDISADLLNGWAVASPTQVNHAITRRQGNWVTFFRRATTNGTTTSGTAIWSIPPGFAGDSQWRPAYLPQVSATGQAGALSVLAGSLSIQVWPSGGGVFLLARWSTSDPWPATLPGTQVTPPASASGALEPDAVGESAITTWTQTEPSATWVIVHNLNAYPMVLLIDGDQEVMYGNITYNSRNMLTVTFSSPVAGVAHLNT